ncbi:MAG TPA: extracellular solute-binding protein [Candidatus Acetothermia bacterium]|nr:extracellular solute-binding protein [Candidatus Acetothermia bacterium]
MKRWVSALIGLLTCLSLMAFSQGDELLQKALQEGKVVFYANITAVEPIMEAFYEKYGVAAEYTRISTSKYLPTVLTEFGAGKLLADVLQAPVPILEILKKQGVLAPYTSPVASAYPEWTMDPDGVIQIFGIEYVGIIYNKDVISPEEAPKRYQDLTDPKWYGKIVMPNPSSHATTISWLIGLKEKVFETEDEWWDFLRGLAANKPLFVKSFGPTPGPIETGERPIGISMPKYIITHAPAPLDWARLEQPLLGTPRGIALSSVAAHPNAAKLFIDYWLSEEAMKLLVTNVGEYVLYPGVYPPIEGIKDATVLPVRTLSEEELEYWAEKFRKIFGG